MYGLLLSAFVLALSATASPLSIEHKRDDSNRAAYFLDNNPTGSSIITLQISKDGLLSSPVRISTGGYGLYGKESGGDAGPDSLFSQDAVVVEQNVWLPLRDLDDQTSLPLYPFERLLTRDVNVIVLVHCERRIAYLIYVLHRQRRSMASHSSWQSSGHLGRVSNVCCVFPKAKDRYLKLLSIAFGTYD
jgi:hypothetical protein